MLYDLQITERALILAAQYTGSAFLIGALILFLIFKLFAPSKSNLDPQP